MAKLQCNIDYLQLSLSLQCKLNTDDIVEKIARLSAFVLIEVRGIFINTSEKGKIKNNNFSILCVRN